MEDVIDEWSSRIDVPCIKNFPYGHIPRRCVLPLGKEVLLDADQSAMEIHSTLTKAYRTLQQNENRQMFNETCTDIIAKKRPTLDKHRGWSEFLVNLAIAIPTLGIGLLIKGVINLAQNKSFFFVHKTESGKIVDEIQDKLDPSVQNKK